MDIHDTYGCHYWFIIMDIHDNKIHVYKNWINLCITFDANCMVIKCIWCTNKKLFFRYINCILINGISMYLDILYTACKCIKKYFGCIYTKIFFLQKYFSKVCVKIFWWVILIKYLNPNVWWEFSINYFTISNVLYI